GWLYSFVDQNALINSDVAMCVTNEGSLARPCVAYADYASHALRFCRAVDAGGTMWGTIREPLTKPSSALHVWGVDIVYSGIVDAPIISMVTEDSDFSTALRSVTAQDANGSAWNPDVRFAEELEPRFWSSLAIIN